jgi:adenylate kinase
MKQQIVALVGISGVGKTTFARQLAEDLPIQHLTAGTLIKMGSAIKSSDRDRLRLADIDENQQFLIDGFHQSRDPNKRYIVMDGHVVIHGPLGLEELSADVFEALKIDGMVHLSTDPTRILEHRISDDKRDRPILSEQEIFEHQSRSIAVAKTICRSLNVPLIEATNMDVKLVSSFILGLQ